MPTFVRWFIKTGLVYFLLGLVMGIGLVADPVLELPTYLRSAFPTYLHVLTVGWITQLIYGVSIWMFPSPDRGGRYGHPALVWGIYWTLNVGIVLRIVAEPANVSPLSGTTVQVALLLSALLQWLSGVLYIVHIWGRVKGK